MGQAYFICASVPSIRSFAFGSPSSSSLAQIYEVHAFVRLVHSVCQRHQNYGLVVSRGDPDSGEYIIEYLTSLGSVSVVKH